MLSISVDSLPCFILGVFLAFKRTLCCSDVGFTTSVFLTTQGFELILYFCVKRFRILQKK